MLFVALLIHNILHFLPFTNSILLYPTMLSTRAAAAGFLVGSAVTAILVTLVYEYRDKDKYRQPKDDNENEDTPKEQSLRDATQSTVAKNSTTRSLLSRSIIAMASSTSPPSHSFLSEIMKQLWDYINVAGADSMRASIEPCFQDLPGPLKTLRFTKIDLGKIPMRIDHIVVHDKNTTNILNTTGSSMVQIDMDLIWDGDCDIQLHADYIGSFGVRSMKFSGRMSLWLQPFTNELPVVSGIQYAFVNPPHLELDFTGLAQVADFAVIDKAVRSSIAASMLGFVLPNKRLHKLQAQNQFLDTYLPPFGVARMTAIRGRGFVVEQQWFGLRPGDIPDVYLNVTLGTSKVWKTKTIHDNVSPEWNKDESRDFVVYDRAQMITVHAYDEDSGPLDPDDDLGLATVRVDELLLAGRTMELELQDAKKHQPTGAFVTMNCEICEWTTDLTSLKEKGDEHKVLGLLVIIINRGFNIPLERKKAASFVKVTYADKEFLSNQITDYPGVDALNPSYDSAFEVPITSDMPTKGDKAVVSIHLLNGVIKPTLLGTRTIDFASLEAANNHTITEQREIGNQGGSVEYRVSLCGVKSTEQGETHFGDSGHFSRPGASINNTMLPNISSLHHKMNGNEKKLDLGDDEAIGTVRITVVKGRGLKIQEELFFIDVPDVYCKIGFGSSSKVWTTTVAHNICVPVWNESREYPLTDHGQFITLDVFDKNEREEDPDVEVGSAKITVGNVLLAGGSMDVELKRKYSSRATGVFITLRCDLVDHLSAEA